MTANEYLISAYNKTKFHVFIPAIVIEIGKRNEDLDSLLQNENVWAYITAYNPKSKVLSEQENNLRHEHLRNKILSYKFFEGEGVGEDPNWKPEKSFLILGISKEDAISIGEEFEQNAIVIGIKGGSANLKVLFNSRTDS